MTNQIKNIYYSFGARRAGKTVAAVEAAKAAQAQGKRILWMTADQASTSEMLSKHGALSEVVGDFALAPRFKNPTR